jgi:predicted house-cleaning noncanonical NTP pyrophosphatase (MazG superfamily)
MRAGLTTSHRTQLLVLSELLNSLEKEVEILHSKYCEAYVILIDVMERLARLTSSLLPTDIIKEKDV